MLRFQLGQQAVDVMDVPRPLHLGHHHHIQLISDLRNHREKVVQDPGAVQAVDARPEGRVAKIVGQRDFDEAVPGGLLIGRRDGVFEVAEQDIHLGDDLGHFRPHLLDLRGKEVDHAVRPRR